MWQTIGESVPMSMCADCFHEKGNHSGAICSGSLTCLCEKFIEPYLVEWAQEVEMYKAQHRAVSDRVKYMLEKWPHLRNARDKTLGKVYKSIWHGFWPSKNTVYTQAKFREMPETDTITRAKRFVMKKHPELQSFDQEFIRHKEAKFQAYLELAIE